MLTKVLIIDDDADMTNVLELILVNAGFDVKTANSSLMGIERARQWRPDIVILDLMIPEMDGIQTCQVIRSFSQNPILVLSVINKPELVARILDAGADDYLIKPVTDSMLIAHLNNLSRRAFPRHTLAYTGSHVYG